MLFTISALVALSITGSVASSHAQHQHDELHKRATSPDNTCGPQNGFTCDPSSPNGGPCCSASGYCGSGDSYCGTGCQPAFGTCGSGSGSGSSSSTAPSPPSSTGCHSVSGVGTFSNYVNYDFSTLTKLPSGLISSNENDHAPTAPYNRTTDASLITVSGGYLNLKVPGGQTTNPIHVGQLQTAYDVSIQYASVRTTAIFSPVVGVCHGFYFYGGSAQEIDIEWLSDPKSTSNPGDGSTPLQLTNHGTNDNGEEHETSPIPSDATTKAHEYRTDWVAGSTIFYVDGKQVQKFNQYVPTNAGSWFWNNWADGDKGWSVGPPATDSILRISKIEMYYNTTGANTC